MIDKKVDNLFDTFITRFNMSEYSSKKTKERLAGKDYPRRTIWLIDKERKNKPEFNSKDKILLSQKSVFNNFNKLHKPR